MLVTWYRAGSDRPLFEERFSLRAGSTPEDRLVAASARKAAAEVRNTQKKAKRKARRPR